jgi:predicted XRE-type DNA-binding protein
MMDDERVTVGSGNVYADFGDPDAEEMLAKARLAMSINQVIARRRLTQAKAATLLGIDQPKVSLIARGQLRGFSVERFMTFLNRLGQEVEISVYPTATGQTMGHTTVRTCDEHAIASAPVKSDAMQIV